MKIGFVSLDHLRDWHGITRLIDQIAAAMAERGHEVTILALEGKASAKTPTSPRDYPHELLTLDLNDKHGRLESRKKIAASGLEICVASIGDTRVLYMPWLFQGSNIPFILGESADPRSQTFDRWQPYPHYAALFSADAVQILLAEYLRFYPEAVRSKAYVIGNPAPPPAVLDFAARREKQTRTIMSAGRFSEEDKRFSFLLRAFALLQKDFPEWRLKLLGDGPYREYYDIMAQQLGISGKVDFPGSVADPGPHYEDADIFCLPSLREGFPMVYLEASAYALPLVGCESCIPSAVLIGPGMGALAEEGEGGQNTPEALAKALRSLMELTPQEREQIGINARGAFQENYGGEIVFDEWEKLLTDTLEKTKAAGETALERSLRMNGIGKVWEGLEPDSPVWTKKLLGAAVAEIAARDDPAASPEQSSAEEQTESVRLRCELARLQKDHAALEKKYASLLGQFQQAAGRGGKRKR